MYVREREHEQLRENAFLIYIDICACCSAIAVCCSTLQCVGELLERINDTYRHLCVLQCIAVCCSALQCVGELLEYILDIYRHAGKRER